MALESLNPFAGLGQTVKGDRFVGRKKEIDLIHQHVLGTEFSNIEIFGLPKAGKSSLAWNSLCPYKEELAKNNTFVIYYSINKASGAIQFFKNLALRAHDEIEEYFEYNETDEKYIKNAAPIVEKISNSDDWDEVQGLLEKYFRKTIRPKNKEGKGGCGYKLIYILDEFDHSNSIFEVGDFQALREHASEADYKICLITCSRKRLHELEKKGDGNKSNFYQIFTDCPVGTFDNKSVEEYWNRVSIHYENLQQQRKIIEYLTGNHPWLMDIVNNYYYIHKDELISINNYGVTLQLMEALDSMAHIVEHEGLLNNAIQLIIGPYYYSDQKQIEKLLKYKFIKKVSPEYKEQLFSGMKVGPSWDGYCYICFSDYSTLDLYRRYYANVPYFSVWSDTENLLRYAVKEYLNSNFSEEWEDELTLALTTNPPFQAFSIERWRTNLESLKNNRDRMIRNFPTMTVGHLVDFTLTAQIFDLFIRPNWIWFNTHIFKGNRDEWNTKFNFLTILRNPVAHNNVIGNMEEEMRVAREYCQDVTAAIKEWQKKRIKK